MKLLLHLAAVSLLIPSALCGVKNVLEHFTREQDTLLPRGSHSNSTQTVDALPPDFHKENTVTKDLIPEEEDEEDYLDLDKILGEDDDYIDIIDIVPQTLDSDTKRGNILELFHGKTRIQRLNIFNTDFGFNVYRSLKDTINASENILLAPVTISTVLAIMSLGVKEQTLQQVMSVSGFEDFVNASSQYDIMTVHHLFHKLNHRLFQRNFGYTLRSVNDVYIQKQFSTREDFRNSMKKFYFAEVQSVDFSDPAFLTRANNRILKLTKGLIKDALVHVNPDLLMLILNCIYFKGTWENKFPVEKTQNLNFRLNEKETVKVPMMKTKGNFLVAADPELDCDVLQLPYVGNVSMLIVLPHKLSGMKQLEKQLTSQVVNKWQSIMTNRTREVFLPRFNMKKSYDLTQVLSSMGIKGLFTTGNFSGISDEAINIGLFKHQGTITVNEEGTEAAAVTVVGFMPLSTQTRFIVDRPFLFVIFEHRTSCLLLMGRVANPSKF
ncbi:heparin cofactor 2 [Rhinatrema bivittatum]|uniref:heparin cofactor 2 n=1 Tax=Rhinatrema bivittatum TaxID=194408 RepID=UPI001126416A|nr:heparin cofactor 2 [Rhinatrema bivittatum]XP_029475645.1 heparin cofactor 2 [Rhinatrema bivittatum]